MIRRQSIKDTVGWLRQCTAEDIVYKVGEIYRQHYDERCVAVRWTFPLQVLQAVAACVGGRTLAAIGIVLCSNYHYYCSGMPDLLLIRARHRVSKKTLSLCQWIGESWQQISFGNGNGNADDGDAEDVLGTSRGHVSIDDDHDDDLAAAAAAADSDQAELSTSLLEETADDSDNVSSQFQDLLLPWQRNGKLAASDTENIGTAADWELSSILCEVKGPTDHLSDKQTLWLKHMTEAGANAFVCRVRENEKDHGGADAELDDAA